MGGWLGKYSRKTYKTPSHRDSSAAELIQSALMTKDDCLEGRNVIKRGKIDVHKTAEAKGK